MEYFIKLSLFIFLVFSLYFIAKQFYLKKKKLPWFFIILYSVLFSLYSVYIGASPMVNDRANYYAHFFSGRDISKDSIAVNYIFNILRGITSDPNSLPMTFGFLSNLIALTAYRYYKQITPEVLLFIFSSLFTIFTFYAYKQAPANALAALSFAIFFSKMKRFPKILFLSASVFLSILFHEVGYALIIVFPCLFLWGNKYVRGVGYILLPIFMVAFPFIYRYLLGNIGLVSESLGNQSAHYAEGGGEGMGALPVLKGMYFYLITYVGIKYRKDLLSKIPDYDRYLFLSVIASFTFLTTAINYWYFRFSFVFVFPVFYFAYNIYINKTKYKKTYINWYYFAFLICLGMTVKQLIQYFYRYGGI